MRLLIIGGSSFVGKNLTRHFNNRGYFVISTYHNHRPDQAGNWQPLNAKKRENIEQAITIAEPTVIINLVGTSNVKYCKFNPIEARQLNALTAESIAKIAMKYGTHLIYLSCDSVFAGQLGFHDEDALTFPATVCGETKLAGEYLTQFNHKIVTICRTSGLYGIHSPVIGWLDERLKNGQLIRTVTNYIDSPTYVMNLAEAIELFITKRTLGTYHVAGQSSISRFDFFRKYAEVFGYDPSLIIPYESEEHDNINSSLRCENLKRHGIDFDFDTLEHGIRKLKREMESI